MFKELELDVQKLYAKFTLLILIKMRMKDRIN
jgi:hypothetical protein